MKNKYMFVVFLVSLVVCVNANAAMVNLVFANGWEVDFDNQVNSNSVPINSINNLNALTGNTLPLNLTPYGEPSISNTGNTLNSYNYDYSTSVTNTNSYLPQANGIAFLEGSSDVNLNTVFGSILTSGLSSVNPYALAQANVNFNGLIANIDFSSMGSLDDIFNSAIANGTAFGTIAVNSDMNLFGIGETTLVSWETNNVSAVPVPAAVWLFGSGLAGLIGFNKKKKITEESIA